MIVGLFRCRDLLVREASIVKNLIDEWWSRTTGTPYNYGDELAELESFVRPLVAAVACGSYLGTSDHDRLWVETIRIVADQPAAMSGMIWDQTLALRRLPAHLLFMGGLLGAWKGGNLELAVQLCQEEILYSYAYQLSPNDKDTWGRHPHRCPSVWPPPTLWTLRR